MGNIAAANITTTLLNRRRNNGKSYFNVKLAFGNGTLTYPLNGVPVTAASFGLPTIVESCSVYDNGQSGFKWEYDQVNSKLLCFESRDQDWVAFTPTASWTSNTTTTGQVRVSGDTAYFQVSLVMTGAPTSASLTVTIPAAYTIDTTKLVSATADALPFGFGGGKHSSAFESFQVSQSATANSVDVFFLSSVSTAAMTAVDATHPITWNSGDEVDLVFSAPITGFAGRQLNGLFEPAGVAIAAQTLKCEVIGW